MRYFQHVVAALARADQLQVPASLAETQIFRHERADAAAVDISDIVDVQHDVDSTFANQRVDRFAQRDVAFLEHQASCQVQHRDVADPLV